MRRTLTGLLSSQVGRNTVVALIVVNAVIIGLETYPSLAFRFGRALHVVDQVILYVFTLEILLRLYAAGSLRLYLRDPWNVFDFLVVGACYLPAAGSYLAAARLLRVLRVLRGASIFPELRRVIATLLASLPSLGHIGFLLVLVVYIYAAVGTFMFREAAPDLFPSLHRSAFTLFQVVTLDGWHEIMAATLPAHPWSWLYFVSFILVGAFVVLNLFIGVIVNNLQRARAAENGVEDFEARVLAELGELRKEIASKGRRAETRR